MCSLIDTIIFKSYKVLYFIIHQYNTKSKFSAVNFKYKILLGEGLFYYWGETTDTRTFLAVDFSPWKIAKKKTENLIFLFVFFFFFLVHPHSMWKFPDHISNPCHSCNNAGSLTWWARMPQGAKFYQQPEWDELQTIPKLLPVKFSQADILTSALGNLK